MLKMIIEKGDPILTKVCHPVTRFNQRLALMLDDLKETLLESGGVGLAAPQVGICRRICVVMNENEEIYELVNPQIVETSGEQTNLEGCLSLPGLWGYVTRPSHVKVRAQDRTGAWFEVEGDNLTARCFCHEIEHLDGHMFDEHCDSLYTTEELETLQAEAEAEDEGVEDEA